MNVFFSRWQCFEVKPPRAGLLRVLPMPLETSVPCVGCWLSEGLWQEGRPCLVGSGCAGQEHRQGGFRLKKEGVRKHWISRAR